MQLPRANQATKSSCSGPTGLSVIKHHHAECGGVTDGQSSAFLRTSRDSNNSFVGVKSLFLICYNTIIFHHTVAPSL